MQIEAAKKRFTVDEYHRMAETGILTERDRVQLIDGEIIQMIAMGARHAAAVRRLGALLTTAFGGRALVGVQLPIQLDQFSEPEPDISVVRPRPDFYATEHPGPEQILLLIEIAESSLGYDRDVKLPIYAADRIAEVWIVDLEGGVLRVYRDPTETGYATSLTLRDGASVSPLAFPDTRFPINEIVPPTAS